MASSPEGFVDATSKKRSRTSKSTGRDDEDAKKARGRPRVEGRDETAADRRRTQIRLAQRAYRQRKETTISSLKRQVHLLQSTIEDMNKAFLNFNDRAVSSGVLGAQPDLAYELRATTEQFLSLAKEASSGSESEDDGTQDPDAKSPRGKKRKASQADSFDSDNSLGLKRQHGLDQGMSWSGKQVQDREELSAFPRSFIQVTGTDYATDLANSDLNVQISNNIDAAGRNPGSGSVAFADIYDQFSGSAAGQQATTQADSSTSLNFSDNPFYFPNSEPRLPDPRANSRLETPWTYSFQETSFARRLHRASLERAFHLIAQAEFRPQRFAEVFRLSLMYASRETIRLKLRAVLTRGLAESLDQNSGPFVHLGGAGLHYERRDKHGALIPKPSTHRRMGPFAKPTRPKWPESPLAEDIEGRVNKEFQVWDVIPGFEGEWFDAYDVAGYLKERGVRLEDNKAIHSFVEAELIEDDVLAAQEAAEKATAVKVTEQDFAQRAFGVQDVMAMPPTSDPGVFQAQVDTFGMDKSIGLDTPYSNTFADPSTTAIVQPDLSNGMFSFDSTRIDSENLNAWMQSGMTTLPDLSPGILTTASTVSDASTAPIFPTVPQTVPTVKKPVPVTIDVAKLINQLISNGKCLGRTPGYRRKDVDLALKHATLQNFVY